MKNNIYLMLIVFFISMIKSVENADIVDFETVFKILDKSPEVGKFWIDNFIELRNDKNIWKNIKNKDEYIKFFIKYLFIKNIEDLKIHNKDNFKPGLDKIFRAFSRICHPDKKNDIPKEVQKEISSLKDDINDKNYLNYNKLKEKIDQKKKELIGDKKKNNLNFEQKTQQKKSQKKQTNHKENSKNNEKQEILEKEKQKLIEMAKEVMENTNYNKAGFLYGKILLFKNRTKNNTLDEYLININKEYFGYNSQISANHKVITDSFKTLIKFYINKNNQVDNDIQEQVSYIFEYYLSSTNDNDQDKQNIINFFEGMNDYRCLPRTLLEVAIRLINTIYNVKAGNIDNAKKLYLFELIYNKVYDSIFKIGQISYLFNFLEELGLFLDILTLDGNDSLEIKKENSDKEDIFQYMKKFKLSDNNIKQFLTSLFENFNKFFNVQNQNIDLTQSIYVISNNSQTFEKDIKDILEQYNKFSDAIQSSQQLIVEKRPPEEQEKQKKNINNSSQDKNQEKNNIVLGNSIEKDNQENYENLFIRSKIQKYFKGQQNNRTNDTIKKLISNHFINKENLDKLTKMKDDSKDKTDLENSLIDGFTYLLCLYYSINKNNNLERLGENELILSLLNKGYKQFSLLVHPDKGENKEGRSIIFKLLGKAKEKLIEKKTTNNDVEFMIPSKIAIEKYINDYEKEDKFINILREIIKLNIKLNINTVSINITNISNENFLSKEKKDTFYKNMYNFFLIEYYLQRYNEELEEGNLNKKQKKIRDQLSNLFLQNSLLFNQNKIFITSEIEELFKNYKNKYSKYFFSIIVQNAVLDNFSSKKVNILKENINILKEYCEKENNSIDKMIPEIIDMCDWTNIILDALNTKKDNILNTKQQVYFCLKYYEDKIKNDKGINIQEKNKKMDVITNFKCVLNIENAENRDAFIKENVFKYNNIDYSQELKKISINNFCENINKILYSDDNFEMQVQDPNLDLNNHLNLINKEINDFDKLIKNIKNNTKQYNSKEFKEATFDHNSYKNFLKSESNNLLELNKNLNNLNKNLNNLKDNQVKTVKIGKLSLPVASKYYKKEETKDIQKSLQEYKNKSLVAKLKKENPILISPLISTSMKVGYSSLAALGISKQKNNALSWASKFNKTE